MSFPIFRILRGLVIIPRYFLFMRLRVHEFTRLRVVGVHPITRKRVNP